MFLRLEHDLGLTPRQVDRMMREYSNAVDHGVQPDEAQFRKYLIHTFKLNRKS